MCGGFLGNYKDKNFRGMLILRPLFQKTRSLAGEAEMIKMGDRGLMEVFGGPGVLKVLGKSFLIMHPLVAVSLIVVLW